MTLPKCMRQLERLARSQGWEIRPTSKGHSLWYAPTGRIVSCHSPQHRTDDRRTVLNLRAELKRAGLQPQ